MQRRWSALLLVALCAASSAWWACSLPEAPPDEEAEGEDAPVLLAAGARCDFAAPACEAELVCTSLFRGDPDLDVTRAACFPTCAAAGDTCTTAAGTSGTCAADPGHEGVFICRGAAQLFGGCGNVLNTACAVEGSLCLTIDDTSTPQDEAEQGVCVALCAQDEACPGGLRCSKSPFLLGDDGVCAPPSTVGDACGIEPFGVCTDGQECTDAKCAAAEGEGEDDAE
jgi:hypothetical protein